jgi:hypothetical protein
VILRVTREAEQLFRNLLEFLRNVAPAPGLFLTKNEEDNMRKSNYVIAALGAIALAVPSIANADTVVIKRGHHWEGARAEYREHRDYGWHRGWLHHRDHDRDGVTLRTHRYY